MEQAFFFWPIVTIARELAICSSLQVITTSQSALPRPTQKSVSQGNGEQKASRSNRLHAFPGSAAARSRQSEPYKYQSSYVYCQTVEPPSLPNNPSASTCENPTKGRIFDSPAYLSTNPVRQNGHQRTTHQIPHTVGYEDPMQSRNFSPQAYVL